MLIDINALFQIFKLELLFKILLLIFIGLYAIFSIMLATKIRSLNKIVFLPPSTGAVFIQLIAILYVLAVISLFFVTLVIV